MPWEECNESDDGMVMVALSGSGSILSLLQSDAIFILKHVSIKYKAWASRASLSAS